MQIDYTAIRSIKSGHSADTDYQIDIDLLESNRMSNTIGVQNKMLDGTTITVVHRHQISFDITTSLVDSSTTPDVDDMREFLDSVKGGETFQLDIDGSSVDYILDSISSPFSEIRNHPNKFRYQFKVRQL